MYKQFTTFINSKAIIHTDFKLLPDRYIQIGDNEPCPIEDYGDFLLSEGLFNRRSSISKILNSYMKTYTKDKRYKFLFADGKTFSVVANSIEQAESYLLNPIKLVSIDKIPYATI